MKNQNRPPRGKPCSIIRVAGGISGEKVLHPLFRFRVGIILSKSALNFVVSVPVNVILLKYKVKRGETMRFYANTNKSGAFLLRNARKRMRFTKSAAYSMRFAEIHNETHHFL